MSVKQTLWVEKYRPETLDDIIGHDDQIARLKKYVDDDEVPHMIFAGPPGCHEPGTEIRMFNGTTKLVEDIEVGDQLMGPDSKPRNVLDAGGDTGEMYRIVPNKGDSFVVNERHVLTLQCSGPDYGGDGHILDVEVGEYLGWSSYKRSKHKLFRRGVEYPNSDDLHFDPYFMGVLIGDGSLSEGVHIGTGEEPIIDEIYDAAERLDATVSVDDSPRSVPTYKIIKKDGRQNPVWQQIQEYGLNCTSGEKYIPSEYKCSSYTQRMSLLAGLLDTDGHHRNKGFEFSSKSRELAEDVVEVCRSVGLAAYLSEKQVQNEGWDESREYYRVSISGDCTQIPNRIPRKKAEERKQNKDVRRTGFEVEYVGEGEYYGFTLDDDGRYLMGDFTVTHNTGKTAAITAFARERFGDNWRSNFDELNASDERGIDTVRNKIKGVARSSPAGGSQYSILFLDEADALTDDAQKPLRRIMEDNSDVTRFFLSCNYPNQIIEALQSRCSMFRFGRLSKSEIRELLVRVAKGEDLEYEDDALDKLIRDSRGDARSAVNGLQSASIDGRVTVDSVETVVGVIDDQLVSEIVDLAIEGSTDEAMTKLDMDLLKEGANTQLLADSFLRVIKDKDMPAPGKRKVLHKLAEVDWRVKNAANPSVQWHSFIQDIHVGFHMTHGGAYDE